MARPPVLGVGAVRRCWRSWGRWVWSADRTLLGEQPSAHRAQWSVSAAASITLDYQHTEVSMFLLFNTFSYYYYSIHLFSFSFFVTLAPYIAADFIFLSRGISNSSLNHHSADFIKHKCFCESANFFLILCISAEVRWLWDSYCSKDWSIQWKMRPAMGAALSSSNTPKSGINIYIYIYFFYTMLNASWYHPLKD